MFRNQYTSSSFYVILPSNTDVEGNKTNSFRVRLPRKLEFNSEWMVGLAVLVYPHTWPSLGTIAEQYIKVIWQTGDHLQIEIPSNSFRNPMHLLSSLNEQLKNGRIDLVDKIIVLLQKIEENRRFLQSDLNAHLFYEDENYTKEQLIDIEIVQIIKESIKNDTELYNLYTQINDHGGPELWKNAFKEARNSCRFQYNEDSQRFSLSFNAQLIRRIELSDQLSYIMGFQKPQLEESNTEAHFVPDMRGGVSSFHVYAPGLIEPVIIGDVTSPLLRVVNIRGMPDEFVEENYVAIQYHRLLVKEVSEICIEIRSASGILMPFQYGTCTLTLHFKKIPYF